MSSVENISVHQLKSKLENSAEVVVLDVREDYERQVSYIPNSIHIPLGMIPPSFSDSGIDINREIVVYCRSGVRSQTAALMLKQMGYSRVYNLLGGITAWQNEIDPSMPVA